MKVLSLFTHPNVVFSCGEFPGISFYVPQKKSIQFWNHVVS